MSKGMKNTSRYPGGGKPVTKSNVKKRGYNSPAEQGKQLGTAKPSTSTARPKTPGARIANKLYNARG